MFSTCSSGASDGLTIPKNQISVVELLTYLSSEPIRGVGIAQPLRVREARLESPNDSIVSSTRYIEVRCVEDSQYKLWKSIEVYR